MSIIKMKGTFSFIKFTPFSKSDEKKQQAAHKHKHHRQRLNKVSPDPAQEYDSDSDKMPRSVSAVISEMNDATAVLSNIIASQKFSNSSGIKMTELDKMHTRKIPGASANYPPPTGRITLQKSAQHASYQEIRNLNPNEIVAEFESDYAAYQEEFPKKIKERKDRQRKKRESSQILMKKTASSTGHKFSQTLAQITSRICTIL